MRSTKTVALLVILAALVAACVAPAGPVQPTALAEPATEPPSGIGAVPSDAEMTNALAMTLGVDAGQITVQSMEAVDWPNACLGIETTDMMCAEMITPGYRIVADVDGQTMELHTNADLSVVLPAGSPELAAGAVPSDAEVTRALASKLGVDAGLIAVQSVEAVDWPNSCLGVDTMEVMCLEAITPGYRIVADVDGQTMELHTNADLSVVLPAGVPEAASGSGSAPADKDVVNLLASTLDVTVDQITVLSVVPVEWPDSCLGVEASDMMCMQVLTPGYRIVAAVDGQQVEVHANRDLSFALVAGTQEPPAGAGTVPSDAEVTKALATKLAVDAGQITVQLVEAVDWPNSCLGVDTMDMMCLEAITPGYRIVADVDGQTMELHTNEDLSVVLPADAPEVTAGGDNETILVWQSGGESCTEAHFTAGSMVFGPCGPRLDQLVTLSAQQAADLDYFATLYASYDAETPAGVVSLTGHGPAAAQPSDQRALAEWAAAAIANAAADKTDARAGLAMTWHREGGIAGFCDDLQVYRGGQAPASSCKSTPPGGLGAHWLSSPQAGQLFDWIDSLASFQYSHKDPAVADAMLLMLNFVGDGETSPSQTEQQAVLDFAGNLFTFGALATDTRYVQADVDAQLVTGPGTQFASIGEVFAGQTAFATGVSQDGRWWRVICPDDTVGDCWLAGESVTPNP